MNMLKRLALRAFRDPDRDYDEDEEGQFPDDERYEASFGGDSLEGSNFDEDPPPDTFL